MLGKELGVPAAQVSNQPPEYIVSAILKLQAHALMRQKEEEARKRKR